MSSKSKQERLQAIRNRMKPLMIEEARKSAMKARVRSYYRQLTGNGPIGRIEREEWEQSQRNLKNKVPEAVEAFKTAKHAVRWGTKIVEPRKRIILSTTAKAPRSPPKSPPKSSERSVTNKNKNKNKKASESRASEAPVSSSTKKKKTFFNIIRNAAKKMLSKLTGKTRKNNKA